jgi:hypothetical protein
LVTGILMHRLSSAMPINLTPISITPPRLPGQPNTPTETPEGNGTPTDFTPGTPTFTPTPTGELTTMTPEVTPTGSASPGVAGTSMPGEGTETPTEHADRRHSTATAGGGGAPRRQPVVRVPDRKRIAG